MPNLAFLFHSLLIPQLIRVVSCYNFPWEGIQLTDAEARNDSDIAFGGFNPWSRYLNRTGCKTYLGDANWPSATKWASFNSSLGGTLIKGQPPAAICYQGPYYDAKGCANTRVRWFNSTFFVENPTSQMEQWTTGNNCPLPYFPFNNITINSTCNFDAQPAYVVNASTVKHVQLAVNFARNNNLRLVIKNTGHDFLGRSSGGGALGLWVHHLKDSQYLPSVRLGQYRGRAMRMGAGMESWEVFDLMNKHNITIYAPNGNTVGAYGGYMQGGGHSILTSYYGLMADQVLSLEVVTADGRFIHADPDENDDLFWAIRGGGGSTFGVVTSVVVKAYPVLPITSSSIAFSTARTFTGPGIPNETFWKGVATYFAHVVRIVDAKGYGNNYLSGFTIPSSSPRYNSSRTFTFSCTISFPGRNQNETFNLMAPLIADLNKVGINITNRQPVYYPSLYAEGSRKAGPGEGVGNGRFGSRLFPRENFEDVTDPIFNNTLAAIREFVEEGGYSFHTVDSSPTEEIAGYPGEDSAVNPAYRNSVVHATGFDTGSYGPEATAEQQIASHKRLNQYFQKLRDVTPDSGAYGNEADTEEPNFQDSFYGENYDRLLSIKRKHDPWGLFYAVTGVGSEEWKIEGTHGLPTQNGRLCRVGWSED